MAFRSRNRQGSEIRLQSVPVDNAAFPLQYVAFLFPETAVDPLLELQPFIGGIYKAFLMSFRGIFHSPPGTGIEPVRALQLTGF